jgi:hypothetical protein
VQQLPKDIVGTHCFLTLALDDSAEVTYMMWREEHIGNVSILQSVHLSDLVSLVLDCNLHYFLFLRKFINELN